MPRLSPQPGPQEAFLSSEADIAIYGGSAGSGKTFGLLMEAGRHVKNPNFGAVIFRRLSTQIDNEGGLWDTAGRLYPLIGGKGVTTPRHVYRWQSGAKITFTHLQYEKDVEQWSGSQVPLLCFDELTHFTKKQFFFMLSRSRSVSGVAPYVRATCNPDADSWVADLLAWWIDQETGFPIASRSGVLRYFTRIDDALVWGDSRQEVAKKAGVKIREVLSITFIPASIYDNKILMEANPLYIASLKGLSRVEQGRLLYGNWKIRAASGEYFSRHEVEIVDAIPAGVTKWVRRWDLAATEPSEASPNPDWTVGVLMGALPDGRFIVADVVRDRQRAGKIRALMKNVASHDGRKVQIVVPQDPGQAGKEQAESLIAMLAGYKVKGARETGDKLARAEPFAAQWQAGNVVLLRAAWNEAFFLELEPFPSATVHDDQVDAAAGAFAELAGVKDQRGRFKRFAT